jgi:hypothetical protein
MSWLSNSRQPADGVFNRRYFFRENLNESDFAGLTFSSGVSAEIICSHLHARCPQFRPIGNRFNSLKILIALPSNR